MMSNMHFSIQILKQTSVRSAIFKKNKLKIAVKNIFVLESWFTGSFNENLNSEQSTEDTVKSST